MCSFRRRGMARAEWLAGPLHSIMRGAMTRAEILRTKLAHARLRSMRAWAKNWTAADRLKASANS